MFLSYIQCISLKHSKPSELRGSEQLTHLPHEAGFRTCDSRFLEFYVFKVLLSKLCKFHQCLEAQVHQHADETLGHQTVIDVLQIIILEGIGITTHAHVHAHALDLHMPDHLAQGHPSEEMRPDRDHTPERDKDDLHKIRIDHPVGPKSMNGESQRTTKWRRNRRFPLKKQKLISGYPGSLLLKRTPTKVLN
jgi:hypothetical protein